eukprot:gene2814-3106_t
MRDVLALVNGILGANSLSLGLGQGVPEVLQCHLADMEQQVKPQLGPPPAGAAAAVAPALEGQVPVLVQAALADRTDELVRLISRQWAAVSAPDDDAPVCTSSSSSSIAPEAQQQRGTAVIQSGQAADGTMASPRSSMPCVSCSGCVSSDGYGICDELPAQMPRVAQRVSPIEQQEGAGRVEGPSMAFGKTKMDSAAEPQCSAGATRDGAWRGMVGTIESAAAVLLAGVDDRRYTLNQLEQQLLASLQETAAEQGLAAAATGAQSVPPLLQRHALSQLLCGAVLHAFLNDVVQRAAVWGQGVAGTSSGCCPSSLSSSSLTTFKVLPSQVMKSVRCDTPQWVLKQLRVWMQGATLGCGRCTM